MIVHAWVLSRLERVLAFELVILSKPMEKRVKCLGYEDTFNAPGDGDCLYASAAKALGIETQSLKKVVFDFLKSHQFDVSDSTYIYFANSRTTKISSMFQLAAIFTGVLTQDSQQLQMLILQLRYCNRPSCYCCYLSNVSRVA